MTESTSPSPNPFFVVGTGRSGSTMLRLMLNQHPDLVVPRESWFLIDLMNALPLDEPLTRNQVELAREIITGHKRWPDLEIDEPLLDNAFAVLEDPRLGDLVHSVFAILVARSGKRRWGDKTPEYLVEIERIRKVFPSAQFIHIIRDGRDVCLSMGAVAWRGKGARRISQYWSKYIMKGIAAGRRLPPESYMEIHYEDLVADQETSLRRICAFLGVAYEPRMTDFFNTAADAIAPWEKGIHTKTMRPPRLEDLHRWKRQMSRLEIVAFETYAHRAMDAVGQERVYRGWKRIAPVGFFLLDLIATWTLPVRRVFRLHFPSMQDKI